MQQQSEIKAVVQEELQLNCRFYEQKYPKEGDLVVAECVEVLENASYVELLEYNGIKGMITPNEMTKPIRGGVQKALKYKQQQVVRVLRVDEEQGYIDLSKKRVQKDEEEECLSKFANAKTVNAIMRTIAEKLKINVEGLYQQIVWPLQKRKENDQCLYFFRLALTDEQKAFQGVDIKPEIRLILMAEIERRLKPYPVTIRADFEIQCLEYEGILLIREALMAGQKKSLEECQVVFEMRGSPVYAGKTTTINKNKGIAIMKEALKEVEEFITKHNGLFKIKNEPKVVGDKQQDQMDLMDEQVDEEDNEEDEEIGMGDANDEEEEAKEQN